MWPNIENTVWSSGHTALGRGYWVDPLSKTVHEVNNSKKLHIITSTFFLRLFMFSNNWEEESKKPLQQRSTKMSAVEMHNLKCILWHGWNFAWALHDYLARVRQSPAFNYRRRCQVKNENLVKFNWKFKKHKNCSTFYPAKFYSSKWYLKPQFWKRYPINHFGCKHKIL